MQHDTMQCGAACLQMVCKYWGCNFTLDYFDQLCSVARDGVSIESISEAASKVHLHSVCGFTTLEKLQKLELPLIIHWNQNHFVVLYKIRQSIRGKRTYWVADPGKGLIKYNESIFHKNWICSRTQAEDRGAIIALQPRPDFYKKKTEHTDKVNTRSFGLLWSYIKQYRQYYWQILIGLALGCFIQLAFPFLTQSIVDIGIQGKDLNFIYIVLLAQLALVFGSASTDFIRRWILLHIGMKINISLVSDFLIKLLKLPMKFFDVKLAGDLIERIRDHKRVETFLTNHFLTVFFSFFSFIILGSVLLIYNYLLFAIFIVGSFLYGGWLAVFLKRRRTLDHLLFEKQALNENSTIGFINNIQEIKLQDCEQRQRWLWEDVQADTFDIQIQLQKMKQLQDAGAVFIREIKNVILTVIAASSVISGDMTLGMMLAVQFILGQLNAPIDELMNFIYALQDVKISLERINEIHKIDNEDTEACITIENNMVSKASIQMSNVDFKYDMYSIKKTLNNISLDIPCGKITAIVGHSGSGKTTLIKLMLGYYNSFSGEITIGGLPLTKINKKYWRRQCGVVMQNGIIFPESIARNIASDDKDINIDKLKRATEIANISEFIEQLPLKYDTIIGRDGIDISQGQKQRLLIARAVYRDPKIIFLDEATNSLDTENEKQIINKLNEFYKNRTVIVIAHRLSTVKNADKIIVLDNGCIAEEGKHISLIAQKGIYYQLVKNQLELGN